MRNLAQVEDTSRCANFKLTAAELKEIDFLSKAVTDNMEQTEVMWQW